MSLEYNPDIHHRHSIRLKGYDYSQTGAYFVTVCVQDRRCLFGDLVDGAILLNDTGRVVLDAWVWLSGQYDYVAMDEYMIMPNHIHGILIVTDGEGGSRTAPTDGIRKSVGRLIGAFKTVSTKQINALHNTCGSKIWQRGYYEHIIRDDESLNCIRQYIINNPSQWESDSENPNYGRGGSRTALRIGDIKNEDL